VRQLGAIWWESEDAYEWSNFEEENGFVAWQGDEPFVKVGYPATGGVWVLKMTMEETVGKGVGIIHNALNMEERCMAIEKLGGLFYPDPKECADLGLEGKITKGAGGRSTGKQLEDEAMRMLEEEAQKQLEEDLKTMFEEEEEGKKELDELIRKELEKKRGWSWRWN
jgi:hypothetical protein